jgi:ribosome-binding protein aMBF1 (putative translation factor)
MDCESCGRHRPSDQVVAHWSPAGAVIMACARCRRLTMRREDLAQGSRWGVDRRDARTRG